MPSPPMPTASTAVLPLSVSIVCKDNQATIGRTLASIAPLAAEIVAVDSGSTDGTLTLLDRAGARTIKSAWLGHVRTKQLALDHCTQPWVLCLDSDESLEPDLAAAIRAALERDDPSIAGYEVNRKVYYRGRPLNFAWQPEPRLRLVRRAQARWTGLDPHDKLEITSPPSVTPSLRHSVTSPPSLPGTLRHDSFPTFAEHLRKQWSHASTMARSLRASGVRTSPLRLMVSPPGAFLKQLILKQAWRDGVPGWLAAASTAAASLMKHAVLLELAQTPAPANEPTNHKPQPSDSEPV